MKKFATALAVLLVAIGGVTGLASPAEAHVGDISVKAVCVDADTVSATYTVGWSNGTQTGKLYQRAGLYGSNGNAGSSTSGWTYVKDVNGKNGSATFTVIHEKSSFSGSNGPWWSSKVVFSDGYGVAADTRIERFDWSKCGPSDTDDQTITFCHATSSASNPYNRLTTNVHAFYQAGHIGHGDDIYPAGSYVKNGQTFSWAAQGDQSLLQFGDCVKPKPEQPEPAIREVPGSESGCEIGGVKTWTDVYTTEYVFNSQTWKWELGEETGPVRKNEQFTPYSDGEYFEKCAPPQPADKIEYGDWVDEEWDCGDTTTIQNREVFTTPFLWNADAREWVEGETAVTSESSTRDLLEEEIEVCPIPIDVPAEPAIVDECGPGNLGWETIPDSTEQVKWTLNEDGSLSVEALFPYQFEGEQIKTFVLPVDAETPCPTDQPEPMVEESSSTAYECGDDFQTVTYTTVTTPYVTPDDGITWVLGEPVISEFVATESVDVQDCPTEEPPADEPPVDTPPTTVSSPKVPTVVNAGTSSTGSEPGAAWWTAAFAMIAAAGLTLLRRRA